MTIATFFHMAREAGVDIKVYDRNDNMPPVTNNDNRSKMGVFEGFGGFGQGGTMAELSQNTFSDHLDRDALPPFLWPVYDSNQDVVGRDKMLLGTLNVVSGLLPPSLYSIYDKRRVHAPLYNIIYGRFSTSKGDLPAVRQIAAPIKEEMRRTYDAEMATYQAAMAEWEEMPKAERGERPAEPVLRSPFVFANSSAAVVYRDLNANDGRGVMLDEEADSLTNMLSKSEYGDYTDLLRKAHHHEECSYKRVTEKINICLPHPCLSILLTCTGSQLPLLLPAGNVSNGLASRFLFYALPNKRQKFRNVFEDCEHTLDETYRELGQRFIRLYHELQERESHPIQFLLTKKQQQSFLDLFEDMTEELQTIIDEDFTGYLFRIALECYRITMVLTALRRLTDREGQEKLFDNDEQALLCDERDFQTAIVIINCLVNHTGRVYKTLFTKTDDPFSKSPKEPSEIVKRFYESLPEGREFKTAEALAIAKELNITDRTAMRYIGDLFTTYQVLTRTRQGIYVKTSFSTQNP